MELARTREALAPLSDQIRTIRKNITTIADQGILGFNWEKRTHELSVRNDHEFASCPDTIRIAPNLAKECVKDELEFMRKAEKAYERNGISRGLIRLGEAVLDGTKGNGIGSAYNLVRSVIDMHMDDMRRHKEYFQAIDDRDNVLGPIMRMYALHEDSYGFFLKKAEWKTHTNQTLVYDSMEFDYESIPSPVGIDKSVDIDKLMSSQIEKF